MKDIVRSLMVSFAIVLASAVIGTSILRAAKIIGNSIASQGRFVSVKDFAEMIKSLKSRDSDRPESAARRRMPETIGIKKVEGVTIGTNPVKGQVNAPVTMVEFSDFQCPFSKRFFQETFPQIEKEYISTGKVKFAYRDLPLGFHPLAKPAAIAVRSAGVQGRYWQMFDKVLQGDSLDRGTLKKYAQELGLNLKNFEKSLDDPLLKEAVENDLKDAQRARRPRHPCILY